MATEGMDFAAAGEGLAAEGYGFVELAFAGGDDADGCTGSDRAARE